MIYVHPAMFIHFPCTCAVESRVQRAQKPTIGMLIMLHHLALSAGSLRPARHTLHAVVPHEQVQILRFLAPTNEVYTIGILWNIRRQQIKKRSTISLLMNIPIFDHFWLLSRIIPCCPIRYCPHVCWWISRFFSSPVAGCILPSWFNPGTLQLRLHIRWHQRVQAIEHSFHLLILDFLDRVLRCFYYSIHPLSSL
jgi:hypothetical protein